MATVLSAIQTTNQLHLGNYLGALKNWIPYQDEHRCFFFLVDLHAITVPQDPQALAENTLISAATYLACGLDPQKSTLFVQSAVPEHAELAWVLTCHSSMGELSRMTQFKDKSSKHGAHIPTGLFLYPVLMAADILLYQAKYVPVGDDQKQHLELARDIAGRMNQQYQKNLFTIPEPMIQKVGARIMSLANPDAKMSKSDPQAGATIFLTDSAKDIEKKFKRAVTDSGSVITDGDVSAGIKNLFSIQAACLGKTPEQVHAGYVGRQYGYLKVETAEIVNQVLEPIRTQTAQILADKGQLLAILDDGATRARETARETLNAVYNSVGFIRKSTL